MKTIQKAAAKAAIMLAGVTLLAAPAAAQEADNSKAEVIESNKRFWKKDSKELRLGYTIANLDRSATYGGSIDGRWGVTLDIMRNIYVHRSPIAGFLKFGIQFGPQINYVNYEKGHGSIGDMIGGGDDDDDGYYDWEDGRDDMSNPTLGKHQLVAGIGIGPTATFMPFYRFDNSNLARLKFRAYFNVVPSYSAYITSTDDETTFHSAFACLFAGGFNIIWRKLDIGFQYKGGRARYKDVVSDIESDIMGGDPFSRGKRPRFASNFYTISIGLCF